MALFEPQPKTVPYHVYPAPVNGVYENFDYSANKASVMTAQNKYLITALFFGPGAVFVLDDWKRIYLDIADPTEYITAMVLIGNWQHWTALRSNKALEAMFDEWKQEVEIKVRAYGAKHMFSLAGSTSPGAAGAAKWLAEGGFIEDKRLRTKEGKAKEKKIQEAVKDRTAEDAVRLGLVPKTPKDKE
jgi:hypothetical protein